MQHGQRHKYFYVAIILLFVTSCSEAQDVTHDSTTNIFDPTSEIIENTTTSDVIEIPDDIQFPKQLWNTRYFFSKDANPNYSIIMDFGIPMNRFDSCVKVTEYPGYEHNFENYYYGTFNYEGEMLHFTFTNAKDEETVKMTWNGKDIILDYCYSPDFEFELPAKGIKVETK